jgi:hypothetical protein
LSKKRSVLIFLLVSAVYVSPAHADCWWAFGITSSNGQTVFLPEVNFPTYDSAIENAIAAQQLERCSLPGLPDMPDVVQYSQGENVPGSVPTNATRNLFVNKPDLTCEYKAVQAMNVTYFWYTLPYLRTAFPQCKPAATLIQLSRYDGSFEDNSIIDKVEPGAIGGPGEPDALLLAKVVNENGAVIPGVGIELRLDVIANGGGHFHDDETRHRSYAGALSVIDEGTGSVSKDGKTLTGNTGTTGLVFGFNGPTFPNNPAGTHEITGTCTDRACTQAGPTRISVEVSDLTPVTASPSNLWTLIGETATHPENHYLTTTALQNLTALASAYRSRFPAAPPLRLNDASLEKGGLFDLYPAFTAWNVPHSEHRRGWVIDIQANGTTGSIPAANFNGFRRILRGLGMTWVEETLNTSNGHFHVRLLGAGFAQ